MIVTKTVQVAQEVDQVMGLFVDVVKGVKAKKSLQELAATEFPALIKAISDAAELPAEAKANKAVVLETIGYRFGEIAGVLLE